MTGIGSLASQCSAISSIGTKQIAFAVCSIFEIERTQPALQQCVVLSFCLSREDLTLLLNRTRAMIVGDDYFADEDELSTLVRDDCIL
jgi:hypothetical protein